MGVGFLHGVLPQGLSRSFFIRPQNIQIVTTDEILFPPEVQRQLEAELQVKFSVTITRDWASLLGNIVASPSADLIFLPAHWAETLRKQNLLADISSPQGDFRQRVASDFMPQKNHDALTFLPFYWMKTQVQSPSGENFLSFLKNKLEPVIFLIADEDLLLGHFEKWKAQGIWDLVTQKKILTLQLDQILKKVANKEEAVELPLRSQQEGDPTSEASALLVWGAVIPQNSQQKELVIDLLDTLTTVEHQESTLLNTPFNTTFSSVIGNEIPLERRAEAIRNLQLKDTLILDHKDPAAREKLKSQFNLIL